MELKELRVRYEIFSKKYKLPSFKETNENFEIEKIDKESDCLLRLVRKVMMEKIVNSLNFLELLLNPVNGPRLYVAYARSISSDDRKEIEDIYAKLGKISISSLSLEIDYSERKEAEMIKEIFITWNLVRPGFRKVLENLRNPSESSVKRKEKSYFG